VVAVYDNTTGQPSDAMAVMFVYIQDHKFKKPAAVHHKYPAEHHL